MWHRCNLKYRSRSQRKGLRTRKIPPKIMLLPCGTNCQHGGILVYWVYRDVVVIMHCSNIQSKLLSGISAMPLQRKMLVETAFHLGSRKAALKGERYEGATGRQRIQHFLLMMVCCAHRKLVTLIKILQLILLFLPLIVGMGSSSPSNTTVSPLFYSSS